MVVILLNSKIAYCKSVQDAALEWGKYLKILLKAIPAVHFQHLDNNISLLMWLDDTVDNDVVKIMQESSHRECLMDFPNRIYEEAKKEVK